MPDRLLPRLSALRVGGLLLAVLFILLPGGLAWLTATPGGLNTAVRLATHFTAGKLSVVGAEGRLLGPLRIQELQWQDAGQTVQLSELQLDWQPGALRERRLQIDTVQLGHLRYRAPDDETPTPLPATLSLPFAVDITHLAISSLDIDGFSAGPLSARLHSDGRQHRLDSIQARRGELSLTGDFQLSGEAPFPLAAELDVQGQYADKPLAAKLVAQGALAAFEVRLTASGALQGQGTVQVTPFIAPGFAQADIALSGLDPALWWPGAPRASLDLNLSVQPDDAALRGSFALRNTQAGRLDADRIPLLALAGQLHWLDGRLNLPVLHARLPGGGKLHGQAAWQPSEPQDSPLRLQLTVDQLDIAQWHSRLRSTRLKGEIAGQLSATQQSVELKLRDTQFAIEASLAHDRGQLDLSRLRLTAGEGRLDMQGQFNRDKQRFSGKGELQRFNPRNFGDWPAARINARFEATGRLPAGAQAGPEIDARFALQDSQFDGQALGGQGRLQVAWPRIPHADIALTLGGNRLQVLGAFGQADDHLAIDLNAPTLAAFGLSGGVRSRIDLRGSPAKHQLAMDSTLFADQQLTLQATGSLHGTQWQGQLTQLRLLAKESARNVQLRDSAPLNISPSGWRLGPAALAGDARDWTASLAASATARQLDLRLQASGGRLGKIEGQLNAGLLSPWQLGQHLPWRGRIDSQIADLGWLADLLGETWTTRGRLRSSLQLEGTPATPRLSGTIQGDELGLRLDTQGLSLSNGTLDATLQDNLLSVRQLGFTSDRQRPPRALRQALGDQLSRFDSPGRLEISGQMRVDRDTTAGEATLNVRMDRVGAWQLPEQWVALSGEGQLAWQKNRLGLQGRIGIDAAYWQLPPASMPRLSDDVVIVRPGEVAESRLRPALDLDLTADLGRHFLFSGAGLETRLAGQIRITASGRDLPRATGSIRTREGRFEAYGQKLEIERGVLSFRGLLDNPVLDVRAMRKGLPVEAGVQIGGTAKRPVIRLVSEPEVPDAEKLSWLVLGHGQDNMSGGDIGVLFAAAGGLLGNDAGNVVQQLKQTFGIDEFGVRQGELGAGGSRWSGSRVAGGGSDTTAITGNQVFNIGKRLSSNALLSYEQSLGTAESLVKLSIALTREISLVGRAGSDNALDIFYTLTWGQPPRRSRAAPDNPGDPGDDAPSRSDRQRR